MAVTYSNTLSTDRDKVRFYINDTVSGAGPKPSSANFDDAEIAGLLTLEGSVGKAVAACLETLAALWAVEVDIAVGSRRESLSQAATKFESLAKTWRDRHGGSTSSVMGVRHLTRVDGYSSDLASNEV